MSQENLAKSGDKVKVHYTGKLEDGKVFDSSRQRDPLEFTIGQGTVIPGFENGVVGMQTGTSKVVEIEPQDGYGPKLNELIVSVNRSDFPDDINPEIGMQLQVQQPDGRIVNVTITNLQDDKVTLDANHPLAGRKLIFDIELVEIA